MKLMQIAVAFDQLVNTLLGGYADETMSSRCWRLRVRQPYKFLRPIIDSIFFWQKDHCEQSFKSELARKYQPKELQ